MVPYLSFARETWRLRFLNPILKNLESILRRRAYTPLDTATHSAIIEPQEMKVRFHRQAEKICNIQCMQAKRLYSSLWLCPCAGHCAECCPYVLLPDSIHRAQSRAVRAGR